MSTAIPRMLPGLAALSVAGAGCAATGLLMPGAEWTGLVVGGLWALAGWSAAGLPGALAAGLPSLAVIGGGWFGLPAWTLAGCSIAATLASAPPPAVPSTTSEAALALDRLRERVRVAEHERIHLRAHLERYPVLLDACLSLSAARNLQQLAEGLCTLVRQLVPDLDVVRVWFGSPEAPTCSASAAADGSAKPGTASDEVRFVLAESRPLVRREGQQVRALLPLRGDRRRDGSSEATLRGVLAVEYRTVEVGDRLAVELLGALSRLGGIGLAAVDLLAQARALALHDELTGLYGQHEFLRRLDEQTAAARRQSTSLGVLMCDMDKLKAYNDRFGHPAGDAALRAVAQALRSTLPVSAVPCRYGGEEFAALLPGVTAEELAAISERLRAAIAATTPDADHPDRHVTASLGWSLLRKDETARDALKRADQHCYAAKAGGRNRVEGGP